MSDPEKTSLPITAAVSPPQVNLPEGFTSHEIMTLIRDVVTNFHSLDYILRKHNLTQEQYNFVSDNPFFKQAYDHALKEWHSPLSTEKRIAIEAAAIVETGMPALAARMYNPAEPLREVIEAAKLFAKMAGLGEEKGPSSAGERFTITINLGADQIQYKPQAPAIDSQAIPTIGQGSGTDL